MGRLLLILLIIALSYHSVISYAPIAKSWTANEIAAFEKRLNENPNVHHVPMDYRGQFDLRWEYDNDSITFEVTANAKGWVGLGFTPSGTMAGADIVLIWIDKNGKGQISDRHAKENGYPENDASQDYVLIKAAKSDAHFTAKFRRLRDTCDDEGDYRLTSDNTQIIYAFSDVQPPDEDHFEIHLSTNRGIRGAFLFDPPDVNIRLPPDTVTLDFLSDNVELPTDFHLMYWCQMFQLPNWPVHHLIRMEPILTPGLEQHVHHIAIYQCSANMSEYLDKGEKCFSGSGAFSANITAMYVCTSKVMWFWNPGTKSTDFPENVGMPLFEDTATPFILFEIHYENLKLEPGLVDRSGIRIFLTPSLRPVDAGLMFLGTIEQAPNQILPPGDPEFHFYAHFDKCMQHLPPNGTYFLYTVLHMHLYGKRTRMHHYRNGVQLPDYVIDDNYNFYAQNYRRLHEPLLVLPGDELVLECVYNTTTTNKTIYGGYSTLDEMCDSAVFYYPRVSKAFTCMSFPDPKSYAPIFGGELKTDDTVLLPSNETVSLMKFVKERIDWEVPGVREAYKSLVSNGTYVEDFFFQPLPNSTDKNGTGRALSMANFTHVGYPKVTQPWEPEEDDRKCPFSANKTPKKVKQILTERPSAAGKSISQGFVIIISVITLILYQ